MANRAGRYAANLDGEARYRSFVPAALPPTPPVQLREDDRAHASRAHRLLGQLNEASKLIPNANLFVAMYVRKEALFSSQIEGTQCTLDDVLDPAADANANLDVADVVNYIAAMDFAVRRRRELPLCNRLLRETHAVLMRGARGHDMSPGEFRTSQNWIGPAGCTLSQARFVPPNVDDMHDALAQLEAFINADLPLDPLVACALVHYQFETIHPFLDGNGRIGRLLILLFLIEKGLLDEPVLYVSYFLKRNQIEYYDRMSEVQRSGDYEQWIRFFLEAIEDAAADALRSIHELAQLHDESAGKIPTSTRTVDNVRRVFDYIEWSPIIDIGRTAKELGISYNTAAAAVAKLVGLGILEETSAKSRNRVFAYRSYLDILRG